MRCNSNESIDSTTGQIYDSTAKKATQRVNSIICANHRRSKIKPTDVIENSSTIIPIVTVVWLSTLLRSVNSW